MGKTNQFRPPAPCPRQLPVPTARFLRRAISRFRLGPSLSSAFLFWPHLPLRSVGANRHRDGGDCVRSYRGDRYANGW